MNAENPVLTQNPNVTQIPVQEYPPQEGQQQYGESPQEGQQSYVQETVGVPQDGSIEHYDVPLHEGSEHEHQVEGETALNTPETAAVPPSEEQDTSSTEQTEGSQPQEDVDAGRWDHDKAETLAHALQSTGEGRTIIRNAYSDRERANRLREQNETLQASSERAIDELQQNLEKKEDLSEYEREHLQEMIDNEVRDLEADKRRAEKSIREQEEYASRQADAELAAAEFLYDKNPEYAAGMSTEDFMEEVDKFTEINSYFVEVKKEDSHLNGLKGRLDGLEEDKDASFLTSRNDGINYYEDALRRLYYMQDHGNLTSQEIAEGSDALVAAYKQQTNPYTYSGAEAIKNMRALIDQFEPAFKARAKRAMDAKRGALESIRNGTPITPLENIDATIQQ